MENRTINIGVVAEIAKALKQYNEVMVFVGGAVVSLYTDDPAADEIRPTKDVDMTLNVINLSKWNKIQEDLSELGFHPDPYGQTICSYKYNDIPVDIMSSDDGPFGPSNKWYKIGFENLWLVKAKNETIRILSAPCYLATKFEAFNNRGTDYRTSHDIEDIIYILDNRTTIVEEILNSEKVIQSFLKKELQTIIKSGSFDEILISHVHPLIIADRITMIKEKIRLILAP